MPTGKRTVSRARRSSLQIFVVRDKITDSLDRRVSLEIIVSILGALLGLFSLVFSLAISVK